MFVRLAIFGALALGVANGLRYCDDCSKIIDCEHATNQLKVDKSSQMAAKLKNAICGVDSTGLPKVCCSDFSQSIQVRFQPLDLEQSTDNGNNNEDDIENHPNVNLLPEACGVIEGNRIVGGTIATPFEFPWMALIIYRHEGKARFDCGGSVINSRYVLTAAHCVKNNIVGVRIGEYNTKTKVDCYGEGQLRQCTDGVQDIPISSKITHQEYSQNPVVINDIALLRLNNSVNFAAKNAGATCLPLYESLRETDISGEVGTVAGWGFTENHLKSDVLLKVNVPIYTKQACAAFYERNRNPNTKNPRLKNIFCAGEIGHDSCGGDSGGPLMIQSEYNESYRVVQYGIVSFGPKLCGSSTPGVYTDVRKFMKWILDTIKP